MTNDRLHALDSLRAFALLLGVAFHAALSFMPGWPPGLWAMVDSSPSAFLHDAAFVAHVFRMSLFFFLAGYFARQLHAKLGARGFWVNRVKRIAVPLVVGWVVLFPAIAFVWGLGITKLFGATPPAPPPGASDVFPLAHLWFLYQLLWLYAAALLLRAVIVRCDPRHTLRRAVDRVVVLSLRYGLAVALLGLPVALTLLALPMWFFWQGIPTPDMTLVPQLQASVGFGTAFAFGWLVHRSSAAAFAALRALWPAHALLAALTSAFLLHTLHTAPPLAQPGMTTTLFALAFGVAVWAWCFALTGMALRFLAGPSPVRRYLADASYWIYLAHLPLVALLQVWVGDWPLHWSVKFPAIVLVSLALLLLSYHWLVRPTWLGALLNGRRYPRRVVAPEAAPASPGDAVATWRGVTKRYGAHVALDGFDLAVAPGELLALLGPNGAGKSTAIALALGLLEPDRGEVALFRGSPFEVARRRKLGVMLQDVELAKELRVRELLALTASYYAAPRDVDEVLELTGTQALARRRYGALSSGQKRQVQFALAICGRPQLLFLDEPTVGLDAPARERLWANVRTLLAEGCAIVLTTHYLEEAEALAQRVAVLADGRIVATGSVGDLRALVERKHIRCDSALAAETVRTWAGVLEATREGAQLRVTASDAEAVVRRLLTEDPALRRLEVRAAGLAEAITQLTAELTAEAA